MNNKQDWDAYDEDVSDTEFVDICIDAEIMQWFRDQTGRTMRVF